MRVDYGPGYRMYFVSRGELLVILLAGGDKRTQSRDIEVAPELARGLVGSRRRCGKDEDKALGRGGSS